MQRIQTGDRIRIATLDVRAADLENPGQWKDHTVSLRFGWTGPDPEHSCVADTCGDCDAAVRRILQRRLGQAVEVGSMTVLRDRQATALDPEDRPKRRRNRSKAAAGAAG